MELDLGRMRLCTGCPSAVRRFVRSPQPVCATKSASYWARVLDEHGFPGTVERREALCELLLSNAFAHVRQLRHVDDPGEWLGADGFSMAELKFIQSLAEGVYDRSRYTSC